ncbi:MAG: N-acetylmuramoyl-L-alanine amidase [Clostridia bacterium]|nr:N-acetylmuramoyl-L-alanine amidase [Clostridia bacterium]
MLKEFITNKITIVILSLLLAAGIIVAGVFLFSRNETEIEVSTDEISSESPLPPSSSVPVSSEVSSAPKPTYDFKITSPASSDVTVKVPYQVLSGVSDPEVPLLINGDEIERDDKGAFSAEYSLEVGNNKFVISQGDKTYTYIVRYRFDIINSYTPSGNMKYESGSTFAVTANARVGSVVTATFDGKTITLTRDDTHGGDEEAEKSDTFVNYSGSFTLPSGNKQDLNLGAVSITATHSGVKKTVKTGNITCKRIELPVVAEVVTFSAETFSGDTTDDASRPTNNYLPKGTVDYVVGRAYNGSKEYLLLRCGRRVYVNKKMVPTNETVTVAREYEGTLPDTNKLSVDSLSVGARHTVLTLNTEWKAPFLLDLLPQKYTNPAKQDYTVSSVTAEYVEITFCYAESLEGEILLPADHPLFSSAEVIADGKNQKLRLNFKKKGAFYGWNAYYNEGGQLVFEFLHPATVTAAENDYGADLTGVTILIDVGHGGKDFGAPGIGNTYFEDERNLNLGFMIKQELEGMGATVIMNRESNVTIKADDRCEQLKKLKPDLCIAIHHDSNASSRPNGFGMYYSTLFSYDAAKFIFDRTVEADIYDKDAAGYRAKLDWHYYFVARMSDCPVVLTENGFMSSPIDRDGIVNENINRDKAKAITRGVADYFLHINGIK